MYAFSYGSDFLESDLHIYQYTKTNYLKHSMPSLLILFNKATIHFDNHIAIIGLFTFSQIHHYQLHHHVFQRYSLRYHRPSGLFVLCGGSSSSQGHKLYARDQLDH